MASDVKVTKEVKWPEVVARVAADKGIPKKQLEEDIGALTATLDALIEEHRPQKVGTCTIIKTPITAIKLTRIPAEQRIDTATGKKVERDECISVNLAVPEHFVTAANVGIVVVKKDDKEDKTSKKKSA